jgi:hypothetical protein
MSAPTFGPECELPMPINTNGHMLFFFEYLIESKPHMNMDDYFNQRYNRAITERIYVVGHDAETLQLFVQGSQRKTYTITLVPELTCNCFDFVTRGQHCGKLCKHLINVLAKGFKLTWQECHSGKLEPEVLKALFWKFLKGFERQNAASSPKLDAECVVCFESIDDACATMTCKICGHRVHAECGQRWMRRSPTCPFCRAAL